MKMIKLYYIMAINKHSVNLPLLVTNMHPLVDIVEPVTVQSESTIPKSKYYTFLSPKYGLLKCSTSL